MCNIQNVMSSIHTTCVELNTRYMYDIAMHYNHNPFYMSSLTCCLLNVTAQYYLITYILILCSQLEKDLNLPPSLHVYPHHGLVAK